MRKLEYFYYSFRLSPSARGPARARSALARIGLSPQNFGPLPPLADLYVFRLLLQR